MAGLLADWDFVPFQAYNSLLLLELSHDVVPAPFLPVVNGMRLYMFVHLQ